MKGRLKRIKRLKHSIIFVYRRKKLLTETSGITRLPYLNWMFCLHCDCVLIISLHGGRFCLRSAGFSSLCREYRYIEDRYIGVLSHTFYCNFCWDIQRSSLYRDRGIIISRIVDIGVPLYYIRYTELWNMVHWREIVTLSESSRRKR